MSIPFLFIWLSHYSKSITDHGEENTDIFDEVKHFLRWPIEEETDLFFSHRLFDQVIESRHKAWSEHILQHGCAKRGSQNVCTSWRNHVWRQNDAALQASALWDLKEDMPQHHQWVRGCRICEPFPINLAHYLVVRLLRLEGGRTFCDLEFGEMVQPCEQQLESFSFLIKYHLTISSGDLRRWVILVQSNFDPRPLPPRSYPWRLPHRWRGLERFPRL